MHTFKHSSSVQLSALLCFIPLVLDNTMMQAHVTVAALSRVLAALTAFPEEPDIQTKGLVLLGVLMQVRSLDHTSSGSRTSLLPQHAAAMACPEVEVLRWRLDLLGRRTTGASVVCTYALVSVVMCSN